jgi:hypothetical protein
VSLIVTPGAAAGAQVAKNATSAIPIVFAVGQDPVELGLVESLARPGGNATGVNFFTNELVANGFSDLPRPELVACFQSRCLNGGRPNRDAPPPPRNAALVSVFTLRGSARRPLRDSPLRLIQKRRTTATWVPPRRRIGRANRPRTNNASPVPLRHSPPKSQQRTMAGRRPNRHQISLPFCYARHHAIGVPFYPPAVSRRPPVCNAVLAPLRTRCFGVAGLPGPVGSPRPSKSASVTRN